MTSFGAVPSYVGGFANDIVFTEIAIEAAISKTAAMLAYPSVFSMSAAMGLLLAYDS